jgi:hypothetical protein
LENLEPPHGYLDMRLAQFIELGMLTRDIVKHLQDLADSGTILRTIHPIVLRTAVTLALMKKINAPQLVGPWSAPDFREEDSEIKPYLTIH